MSGRGYLSIGDVLTLLREEFPDVTISKIRFLESQGLVEPERSPSGYRKFYERDVERLRWVLRQQREHFLPLKVIRDRLGAGHNGSAGVADDEGSGAVAVAQSEAPVLTEGDAPAAGAGAQGAPRPAAGGGLRPDDDPGAGGQGGREAPVGVPPLRRNGHRGPASVQGAVPDEPVVAQEPGAERAVPGGRGPTDPTHTEVGSQDVESRDAMMVEGTSPPDPGSGTAGSSGSVEKAGPEALAPPAPEAAAATVMTAEELCAASGISQAELEGLEQFGLLARVTVAGISGYDQDALSVARIAAGFARFGVEPRHLRLFRNACDRELGLLEQIITPLLRQRNPEARQRATDAANELGRLGDGLHTLLRRQGIRSRLE